MLVECRKRHTVFYVWSGQATSTEIHEEPLSAVKGSGEGSLCAQRAKKGDSDKGALNAPHNFLDVSPTISPKYYVLWRYAWRYVHPCNIWLTGRNRSVSPTLQPIFAPVTRGAPSRPDSIQVPSDEYERPCSLSVHSAKSLGILTNKRRSCPPWANEVNGPYRVGTFVGTTFTRKRHLHTQH